MSTGAETPPGAPLPPEDAHTPLEDTHLPPAGAGDATTGTDSLSKAVRRNLSAARLAGLWRRGAATLKARGWQALAREIVFRFNLATHREVWRYRADIPLRRELAAQRQWALGVGKVARRPRMAGVNDATRPHSAAERPLVSVVVPLYNTPPVYLRQMVESVLGQSYPFFELILADGSDAAHPETSRIAIGYTQRDGRIKHLKLAENLGISGNTNVGLNEAAGHWITLLDHDDVLQPNALFEVVRAGQQGAELIYSDEIVLDETLKKLGEYHFKGDYGPDTLRGCNTITHLCAFTHTLLAAAGGGQRSAFDGAQDYDLFLRLTEHAQKIVHLPKVLYFWRRHGGSTAADIAQKPAAVAAGVAAVQAQLDRLELGGVAEAQAENPGAVRVRYAVRGTPLVSVLIPSCDHADDLERCLNALYAKAGWPHMEVLVLENNSKEPATEAFYSKAKALYPGLRVERYPGPFNYADINNFGARCASGQHLLLLNNDVELIDAGFVAELLGYSQRPDVGAVGAMLYYPDATVQHAGLIVGIGGTAGVSHKGHPRGDGGDMYRLATAQNLSAVTGAALMVKAELYRRLGGLDAERFAVAFNDVDFCLRLREAGLVNVFTPFATAWHYESKSRGYDTEGPRKARFDKEAAAFRQRWAALLQTGDPYYNPHFTLKTENFAYR